MGIAQSQPIPPLRRKEVLARVSQQLTVLETTPLAGGSECASIYPVGERSLAEQALVPFLQKGWEFETKKVR